MIVKHITFFGRPLIAMYLRMSPDAEENFRARCGVETVAPRELKEGRPNNML